MAIIGGGESCFEETQTLPNQQPVTLDQFLTLLNEFRKEMGLPPKKDTFDDTVSQNLNETMYLKEELKPEKETPLQDFEQSVERGRKDSPYGKDLQLFNLKETFPELLTLQKAIFKIKKKIGKGILRFLYKNGLFNLFKESCAVFNEQDIDDTQYQMENPDFVINADGGIKLRKKPRKKYPELPPLVTSTLGALIPAIFQEFPEPRPLVLKVSVPEAPTVKLQKGMGLIQLRAAAEIVATEPGGEEKPICTVNIDASLLAKFSVEDNKLKISAQLDKSRVKLVSSNVGKFDVSLMEGLVSKIFEVAFLPAMNEVLGGGVPLPKLLNIDFNNASVDVIEDLLVLSA